MPHRWVLTQKLAIFHHPSHRWGTLQVQTNDEPPSLRTSLGTMHLPSLLPSNSLSLSEQVKQRSNQLWCKIIRTNYNTQFAQAAPELAGFRHAAIDGIDGIDDESLSEMFQKTVHLTTYDAYEPFIDKLSENPCKSSAVVNLLAPGLPDYVVESSSTSGGHRKTFPRYNRSSKTRSSDTVSLAICDPHRRRTRAFIWSLCCDQMNVEDEDNRHVATIYRSFGSAVMQRRVLFLDPVNDRETMGLFILDHAAPYAAGFIRKWRSFLLIHALFAIGSRALETMEIVFISTFVDMMHHLDAEFDVVVDCIANGTILILDGIEELRKYLEPNISPDPERAAELRRLGRPSSRPRWCSYVWPHLRSVNAIASGSFASAVPLAQWYLGPNTSIHPGSYGSSEAQVGSPYDPLELNMWKPSSQEIIEFLDVNEGDSINALKQPWNVEAGRRYEVVLTTNDGLWRYCLGDVVEIAGFDPIDGIPVMEFVYRRNVAIRFRDFAVGEIELRMAMSTVARTMLLSVVDWTTTIDNRSTPNTIGVFIELAGDQASDLASGAPDRLLEELLRSNPGIAWVLESEFRRPTFWLVRPGTFSDFRQLKLDEGSRNVGQVKVPVVLPKVAYVTWFLDRVVHEL